MNNKDITRNENRNVTVNCKNSSQMDFADLIAYLNERDKRIKEFINGKLIKIAIWIIILIIFSAKTCGVIEYSPTHIVFPITLILISILDYIADRSDHKKQGK